MDGETTSRLIYLGLLLAAVAGTLVTAFRRSPNRALQQVLVWGLIFAGLVAGYGLWPDIQKAMYPRKPVEGSNGIELTVAADGHYSVDAIVNSTLVTFMIDTGASDIVLSRKDAQRAGIAVETLNYNGIAETANGTVKTARVALDQIVIGTYEDFSKNATVSDGEMSMSLLGMSYLADFDMLFIGNKLHLNR
ncbi:MAG: TIGR02281 family clan AA aspartic protease [Paracoccaceae bacterium]